MATDDARARQVLRAMCRRSFFFFTKAVICYGQGGKNYMGKEEFKERQDWIQWIVCDHKRGWLEDPRAHMKTWGSTLSVPGWLAIQHPDERYDDPREVVRAREYLIGHPHLKGVDSRLVLYSDSKSTAMHWVGSNKSQWEVNPLLRWLFPERVWENFNNIEGNGGWSDSGYVLPGRVNPMLPDAFLRPASIESKEQGGRADGIFFEDLVGEGSANSPLEIEKRRGIVKSAPQLLENLNPDDPRGGWILGVGNRWTLVDVNSMIHDEMPRYAIWRRASVRCIVHGAGNCGRWPDAERDKDTVICAPSNEPLWKDVYPTMEALANVEATIGSINYAAQWLNDPTSRADLDETKFVPFSFSRENVTVDGKLSREWCAVVIGTGETIPIRALTNHVISIDPAESRDEHSARTAVSWFALDKPTRRRFWLDCRADRWGADRSIKEIYDLYNEVSVYLGREPRILCERVALQGYVGSSLRSYAAARDTRLSQVEEVRVPKGRKDDRQQETLSYLLGNSLLCLRTGLALPRSEVRHSPAGTRDAIDTLVQAETVFSNYVIAPSSGDRNARLRQRARERRLLNCTTTGASL